MVIMNNNVINTINNSFGSNCSWGKIFNFIQDVAEKTLTKKEFYKFLELTNNEVELCDGEDGHLVNGHYYDWKEFDIKRDDMVNDFLDIFDNVSSTTKSKVIDAVINALNK